MGFFSKDESTPSLPPNKTKRKECWDARDKFFECLTSNNIDNSLDPKEMSNVESNCGQFRTDFKNKCVASWFQYFQEKRYNDLTRQRYIAKLEAEGAQPLPFKISKQ
ncbi:cytochrome c oxidase assembly factor 6 [[Candida] railenensis]|uniref:Cytochrome c oxidase assembly factor 6 n=1 Tax=[Candida] railenensis TaxID=45579 RepID=A0A9P0VY07_9ASCO|nr:cytochrome c oxidase assembly factor 6 [[Candida] railenensis]